MKKLTLILTLIPFLLFSQSEVPEKYWLNDKTFDEAVIGSAFGDSEQNTIVVEFWAKFNEENCFADWQKISDAKYYRIDIAQAPNIKKKYRVRMAPTIMIFKNGTKQVQWKAGLDLELPTNLQEVQGSINEINNENKF